MPAQPSGLAFKFGYGKQTAEGSALAQPTYDVPYWGGTVGPAQEVSDFEVNSTSIVRPGRYKNSANWATDGLVVGAFPDSAGLLFLSLLGEEAVSGTTPKVHTVTPLDPNPIWVAFFGQIPAPTGGTVTNARYNDGVVSAIEIQFAAGQPVRLGVEASGKSVTMDVPATWTPGTTEQYASAGPYIHSVAPTLKMDHDATPATTTVTNILSGSVRIERAVTWEATTAITPEYRSQSLLTATASLTVEYDTTTADYVRATYFGSDAGTTLSPIIVSGALDFTFQEGPTTGDENIQVQLPNVDYMVTWPTVDTGGGPLHAQIEGSMSQPASGDPVTVIVKNGVTSAY